MSAASAGPKIIGRAAMPTDAAAGEEQATFDNPARLQLRAPNASQV